MIDVPVVYMIALLVLKRVIWRMERKQIQMQINVYRLGGIKESKIIKNFAVCVTFCKVADLYIVKNKKLFHFVFICFRL